MTIYSEANVYALIDTHAHLDEIENLAHAISSARENSVKGIIAVGQDLQSNIKVLELSEQYPGFVYPSLGLHPWALGDFSPSQLEQNIMFISDNLGRSIALGEVGLDYDKRVLKRAAKDAQQEVLATLLKIAASSNKPVSLHSRYAWKDCLKIVKELEVKKVVFHWYTGFSSTLSELIDSGYFISVTPAAEYHEEHRRAVREAPLTQLLLETDCPVHYGRENRYQSAPADVVRSLRAAAAIKGIGEAELAAATSANARSIFGI